MSSVDKMIKSARAMYETPEKTNILFLNLMIVANDMSLSLGRTLATSPFSSVF